jgi:hypothetical protein
MAALTVTAASVVPSSTATLVTGVAGVAITAGQLVYLDSATGKYGLCDADSGTPAVRVPAGIAVNGAAANQSLTIATKGPVTVGATVTQGLAYYSSPTAGGISPVADLIAGNYPSFLGFATSASVLTLNIVQAGVVI